MKEIIKIQELIKAELEKEVTPVEVKQPVAYLTSVEEYSPVSIGSDMISLNSGSKNASASIASTAIPENSSNYVLNTSANQVSSSSLSSATVTIATKYAKYFSSGDQTRLKNSAAAGDWSGVRSIIEGALGYVPMSALALVGSLLKLSNAQLNQELFLGTAGTASPPPVVTPDPPAEPDPPVEPDPPAEPEPPAPPEPSDISIINDYGKYLSEQTKSDLRSAAAAGDWQQVTDILTAALSSVPMEGLAIIAGLLTLSIADLNSRLFGGSGYIKPDVDPDEPIAPDTPPLPTDIEITTKYGKYLNFETKNRLREAAAAGDWQQIVAIIEAALPSVPIEGLGLVASLLTLNIAQLNRELFNSTGYISADDTPADAADPDAPAVVYDIGNFNEDFRPYFTYDQLQEVLGYAADGDWDQVRGILNTALSSLPPDAASKLQEILKTTNFELNNLMFNGFGSTTDADYFAGYQAEVSDGFSFYLENSINNLIGELLDPESSFAESFQAERLNEEFQSVFSEDERIALETAANQGDYEQVAALIEQKIGELEELLAQYAELIANNIGNASQVQAQLSAVMGKLEKLYPLRDQDAAQLSENMFCPEDTEFLMLDLQRLEDLKSRINFLNQIERLLAMVHDAEINSHSTVQQIMIKEVGYQGMNLKEIASNRAKTVDNFLVTREGEIYDHLNNHNTLIKAELEEAIRESEAEDNSSWFVRVGGSIITFITGLAAAIFSFGMAAPLVMSAINLSFNMFLDKQTIGDKEELEKQLQKLEEQLALLKAAEIKKQKEIIQDKIEKLQEEKQAAESREHIDLLEMQLAIYQQLANMELNQLTPGGYNRADLGTYYQNRSLVSMMTSALALYESLMDARHRGYEVVSAEMGVAVSVPAKGYSKIAEEGAQIIRRLDKQFELEMIMAQQLNKAKQIREELKKMLSQSVWGYLASFMGLAVDAVSLGMGSSYVKAMISSFMPRMMEMLGFSTIADNYDYNDEAVDLSFVPEELGFIRDADLLQKVTSKEFIVDYDSLLLLREQLRAHQLASSVSNSVRESVVSSRNTIHKIFNESAKGVKVSDYKKNLDTKLSEMYDTLIDSYSEQLSEVAEGKSRKAQDQDRIMENAFKILADTVLGMAASGESGSLMNSLSDFVGNNSSTIYSLISGGSDVFLKSNSLYRGEMSGILATNFNETISTATLDSEDFAMRVDQLMKEKMVYAVMLSVNRSSNKARDMIHQELGFVSGASVDMSRDIEAILSRHLIKNIQVSYQNLIQLVDFRNRQRSAANDLGQTVLSELAASSIKYFDVSGRSDILAGTVKSSFAAMFAVQEIVESSLKVENAKMNALPVNMENAEADLMSMMADVKADINQFGASTANLSALEYLSQMLKKIRKVKELRAAIAEDINNSRSKVHSIIDGKAGEIESVVRDMERKETEYYNQMVNIIKRNSSEQSSAYNEKVMQEMNNIIELQNSLISTAQGVTALGDNPALSSLSAIMSSLSEMSGLFNTLMLVTAGKGQAVRGTEYALDGLSDSERLAVAAMESTEKSSLQQVSVSILKNDTEMIKNLSEYSAKMFSQKIAKELFFERLSDLSRIEDLINELKSEERKLNLSISEVNSELGSAMNRLSRSSVFAEEIRLLQKSYAVADLQQVAELSDKLITQFLENYAEDTFRQTLTDLRQIKQQTAELLQMQQDLAGCRDNISRVEGLEKYDHLDMVKIFDNYQNKYQSYQSAAESYQTFLKDNPDLLSEFIQNMTGHYQLDSFSEILPQVLTDYQAGEIIINNKDQNKFLELLLNYIDSYQSVTQDSVRIYLTMRDNNYLQILNSYNESYMSYKDSPAPEYLTFSKAQLMYANYLSKYQDFADQYQQQLAFVDSFGDDDQKLNLALENILFQSTRDIPMLEIDVEQKVAESYALNNIFAAKQDQGLQEAVRRGINDQSLTTEISDLEMSLAKMNSDLNIIQRELLQFPEVRTIDITALESYELLQNYLSPLYRNKRMLTAADRRYIMANIEAYIYDREIELLELKGKQQYQINPLIAQLESMEELSRSYNDTCRAYLEAIRTEQEQQQIARLSSQLEQIKSELEKKQKKYQEDTDKYLAQVLQQEFSL